MRVPTVLETTRLRLLPLRSEDTQTIHDLMYNSASVRVAEKLGFVLVRQAVVAGRKTLFFKLSMACKSIAVTISGYFRP